MTKQNPDLWPLKSVLSFYKARTRLLWSSKDRKLDLADSLMGSWTMASRTVYFGIAVNNAEWRFWDEQNVAHIEKLIDRDLSFDAYRVRMTRLTQQMDLQCSNEFLWKLVIRSA